MTQRVGGSHKTGDGQPLAPARKRPALTQAM